MNLFEMEKHHTKTLWLLALLLTFSTVVWAQGTPVTGRVSDEKGELLIGVSVQEKGTTNGTITDTNGQYNLKLTSNNPILIVSYIGYKSQEVKVGRAKRTVNGRPRSEGAGRPSQARSPLPALLQRGWPKSTPRRR